MITLIKRLDFEGHHLSILGIGDKPIGLQETDVATNLSRSLVKALPDSALAERSITMQEIEDYYGFSPFANPMAGIDQQPTTRDLLDAEADWLMDADEARLLDLFDAAAPTIDATSIEDPFTQLGQPMGSDTKSPTLDSYFRDYTAASFSAPELASCLAGHEDTILLGYLTKADLEWMLDEGGWATSERNMGEITAEAHAMFGDNDEFRQMILSTIRDSMAGWELQSA
jgi:hypothetical protein